MRTGIKRWITCILVSSAVLSAITASALAAGPGWGWRYADADGDGICDNRTQSPAGRHGAGRGLWKTYCG